MIVGGFFDGGAVAALPPVIAAALAAACVVVMAGAAAVALSGRRARRRRTCRAVIVDFTGQRLTPYDHAAEFDFVSDADVVACGVVGSATYVSPEERLWADIQAVGEPGGLQRVVDGLNEAS